MSINKKQSAEELYGDIIHLPHPQPKNHPRMDMYKRAAQFAPFAALTGYDQKVEEAARFVDRRIELTEDDIRQVNEQLRKLEEALKKETKKGEAHDRPGKKSRRQPTVRVCHFQADQRKEGGSYIRTEGSVKKMDGFRRELILSDGSRIAFEDIVNMEIMDKGDVDEQ